MPNVLNPTSGGGPHGLGDPDDRTLRKVETEIKIPQIMRDRAKAEKCDVQAQEFAKCAKETGLLMTWKCKQETKRLMTCLEEWYNNEEFKKECTEQYLAQRKEYRSHGKKEAMKTKKPDMF